MPLQTASPFKSRAWQIGRICQCNNRGLDSQNNNCYETASCQLVVFTRSAGQENFQITYCDRSSGSISYVARHRLTLSRCWLLTKRWKSWGNLVMPIHWHLRCVRRILIPWLYIFYALVTWRLTAGFYNDSRSTVSSHGVWRVAVKFTKRRRPSQIDNTSHMSIRRLMLFAGRKPRNCADHGTVSISDCRKAWT